MVADGNPTISITLREKQLRQSIVYIAQSTNPTANLILDTLKTGRLEKIPIYLTQPITLMSILCFIERSENMDGMRLIGN